MSDGTNIETAATDNAAPEPTIDEVVAKVFGTEMPAKAEPESESTDDKAPAEEPVKEPEPERTTASARIIAAKRADLRAAQARAELAAQKADIEKQRSELKEQAELVAQLREAKLSPSKALELLGMSPKDFLESLATEHEPEAVAKRAMGTALTETEKLRAELAELKQALSERDQGAQRQEIETRSIKAQEAFFDHVTTQTEKYVHTVEEFTPTEIVQKGWALAAEYAQPYYEKFGVYPDDEVIAEELERQAKARAYERTAWRARSGKSEPTPSQGTPEQLRATQPGKGPSPRTLTSRAASEKATVSTKWSQQQADEESLRILQQALKAG